VMLLPLWFTVLFAAGVAVIIALLAIYVRK
jgi:hypothetical protein